MQPVKDVSAVALVKAQNERACFWSAQSKFCACDDNKKSDAARMSEMTVLFGDERLVMVLVVLLKSAKGEGQSSRDAMQLMHDGRVMAMVIFVGSRMISEYRYD